jgi:hypothetical protein
MPHTIEPAKTGRAKCRGCNEPIAAGTLRLGERVPNPFGDEGSETTLWFHVPCAAFLRPEAFVEVVAQTTETIPDRATLEHEAQLAVAHRRLARATTAGRAPTGRATCRSCKQLIEKDAWRIALLYFEDSRFSPSGFIHVRCAKDYLETTEIFGRLKHFSPGLMEIELAEIRKELGA